MLETLKKNKKIVIPLTVTLATYFLLNMVILIAYVPTSSMEPTIKTSSYIICNRLANDFKKGDVVVFIREGELLVKRIAGCGGDTVYINGIETVVPNDKFYMLGDNSKNSFDSRYWDDPFIPLENIIAKPIKKY